MKLFSKILILSLVIGCIVLASGCKKNEKVPSNLPDESITESNGSVVEDEIDVDDLLGDGSTESSKDESKPTDGTTTNNNSGSNTSSDNNNSDNISSDSSNSSNSSDSSDSSNSSSTPSTSEDNKLPGGGDNDNKGYISGWY